MSDAPVRHARGSVPHRRAGARSDAGRRVGRAGSATPRRRRPARAARVPERARRGERRRRASSSRGFARRARRRRSRGRPRCRRRPRCEPDPAPAPRSSALRTRARRQGDRVERAPAPRARRDRSLFLDADVSLRARTPSGGCSARSTRHPTPILASAKTTCAARPTLFEARDGRAVRGRLPESLAAALRGAHATGCRRAMPEDLLEPERWLELDGRRRAHRARARARAWSCGCRRRCATSSASASASRWAKVQLARELSARSLGARRTRSPDCARRCAQLGPADCSRLGAYLALRETRARGRAAAVRARADGGRVARRPASHEALGCRVKVLCPGDAPAGAAVARRPGARLPPPAPARAPRHDITCCALAGRASRRRRCAARSRRSACGSRSCRSACAGRVAGARARRSSAIAGRCRCCSTTGGAARRARGGADRARAASTSCTRSSCGRRRICPAADGPPVVLDLIDALSANLARRARAASADRSRRSRRGRRRGSRRFERALIERAARVARGVAPPSATRSAAARASRVVPNGVDLDAFAFHDGAAAAGAPRSSSATSATSRTSTPRAGSCDEILPARARRRCRRPSCSSSGARPARAVRALARAPGVLARRRRARRWRPRSRRRTVAVVPMRAGTGLQNKVLEAMAVGTPGRRDAAGGGRRSTCAPASTCWSARRRAELAARRPWRCCAIRARAPRRMAGAARALVERRYRWEDSAPRRRGGLGGGGARTSTCDGASRLARQRAFDISAQRAPARQGVAGSLGDAGRRGPAGGLPRVPAGVRPARARPVPADAGLPAAAPLRRGRPPLAGDARWRSSPSLYFLGLYDTRAVLAPAPTHLALDRRAPPCSRRSS